MVNSNNKGKVGEREVANILKKEFGLKARRGQQHSGSPESPDIVTELTDYHFEIKRTETLSLYKAMEQAINDAGDAEPVVVHRRSNKPWLAIIDFRAFIRLVTGKDNDMSDLFV